MASLRDTKLRIRSVKSTQKITKAMEMISASKMKKAQQQALKGRPYLNKLSEIIANLVIFSEPKLSHPLLEEKTQVKNVGYILLTSNKGLCGGFNTNVCKKMLDILNEKNQTNELVITVGKKGRQMFERIGKSIVADFEALGDKPTFVSTLGITKVVVDDFLAGKLDEVYVVYNHFNSTVSQVPRVVRLLPVDPKSFRNVNVDDGKSAKSKDYIFEQEKEALLNDLLNDYVKTMVYQTLLESSASEHSASMMAMRQASDNAAEIVSNLTLHYNKARQAKITTEILEVVAGASV